MRTIIRAASVVLALALGLGLPTANAASVGNAARLVDAMGLEAEIERAIGDVVALLRTQMTQQGLAADKVNAFLAALREELTAATPALIDEMTRVYADRFSDGEIDDLVDFYGTPTGQKLVTVQADLATAQTAAIANWINAAAQEATRKLAASGASV
jgi:hypothetical protein